jgi:hypothetical protein
MQNKRSWITRDVEVSLSENPGAIHPVVIEVSRDNGSKLAMAIRRMQQTTVALPPEVAELADALDYVLVGDPFSRTRHASLGVINSHGYVGDGGPCQAERGGGREARCGRPMQRHAMRSEEESRSKHETKRRSDETPMPRGGSGSYPDSPSDADFERDREGR